MTTPCTALDNCSDAASVLTVADWSREDRDGPDMNEDIKDAKKPWVAAYNRSSSKRSMCCRPHSRALNGSQARNSLWAI